MKFKINGDTWIIEEKSLKDLINLHEEADRENVIYCFGITMKHKHEIYINEEMCEAQKIRTLKHELMHCYLWEYGLYGRDYTEEDVCDLCAGSNDFVNKVIKEYSKNDEEEIKKLKEKIKNSINIPVEGKLCGV